MRVTTPVAVLLFLSGAAAPLAAQTLVNTPGDSAQVIVDTARAVREGAPTSSTGAALTGLRSGVHVQETARDARPTMAPTRAGLGQARAMMIVGAAALITGGIIGGDAGTIIMVGGAVIGLIGLYEWLQ